jgi:hypothetical protein
MRIGVDICMIDIIQKMTDVIRKEFPTDTIDIVYYVEVVSYKFGSIVDPKDHMRKDIIRELIYLIPNLDDNVKSKILIYTRNPENASQFDESTCDTENVRDINIKILLDSIAPFFLFELVNVGYRIAVVSRKFDNKSKNEAKSMIMNLVNQTDLNNDEKSLIHIIAISPEYYKQIGLESYSSYLE